MNQEQLTKVVTAFVESESYRLAGEFSSHPVKQHNELGRVNRTMLDFLRFVKENSNVEGDPRRIPKGGF